MGAPYRNRRRAARNARPTTATTISACILLNSRLQTENTMSTETPETQARPLRLSEGQTEMLMKALQAAANTEPPSGLTDTQFIRLRLESAGTPDTQAERKENKVY